MNKSTNGKGKTILRDEWETPQWLFDLLDKQYHFHFDCCANEKNKKCQYFSDDFEKEENVNLTAWMNPPFSIAYKMFRHFVKVVHKGIAIYRCDNLETAIWQEIIFPNTDWIFTPKGRINYEGLTGDKARFPSALIGIGLPCPNFLNGTILKKIL